VALIGVTIMVGGDVADGHLFGDLLAFGMTICMAIVMLIIRQHHETPMLPAACLSALLCPLLVWPFAAPIDVSMPDLLKLFLFGTTQFGLGLVTVRRHTCRRPELRDRHAALQFGAIVVGIVLLAATSELGLNRLPSAIFRLWKLPA
jgi:hypothetical protein